MQLAHVPVPGPRGPSSHYFRNLPGLPSILCRIVSCIPGVSRLSGSFVPVWVWLSLSTPPWGTLVRALLVAIGSFLMLSVTFRWAPLLRGFFGPLCIIWRGRRFVLRPPRLIPSGGPVGALGAPAVSSTASFLMGTRRFSSGGGRSTILKSPSF